jgi:hypothetical protein
LSTQAIAMTLRKEQYHLGRKARRCVLGSC